MDPIANLVLGLTLLITFIWLRKSQRLKLTEPPLVPYKYPIIGHTIEFYTENETLIKKCREEYGEIFSLYVFGRVITIVGKELCTEIFKNHETFDFGDAHRDIFPIDDFLYRPRKFFRNVSASTQIKVSKEFNLYTERIQRQLIKTIDELIGDGKVLQSPLKFFQYTIARPMVAAMVGEELCDDEELVNSFACATSDLMTYLSIPPFLNFIHPVIHKNFIICGTGATARDARKTRKARLYNKFHREVIKRKVAPIIEKRINYMKKLGDACVPQVDMLQHFINAFRKGYTVDVDVVTDFLIVNIFASVHNMSTFLTFGVQEFANHPQFQKELLDEQEKLYDGSTFNLDQINKKQEWLRLAM
ncbi:16352_t:CDS:2, partial [Funneliformis caledonium]